MPNADHQNWSTAKLKRRYIKAIKHVWYYDKYDLPYSRQDWLKRKLTYRYELDKRGIMV